MKKAIIFIFALYMSLTAIASDRLGLAQEAYEKGDYPEAVRLYNEVIEKEGSSASLLYNLGNSYVKAGDVGNAVVCYERALKLSPSNKKIENNLNYINGKIADANMAEAKGRKVGVDESESFFVELKRTLLEQVSSNTYAVWGVVCFLLLLGCVALYMFVSNVGLRKIGFFGSMAMIVCLIVFIVLAEGAAKSFTDRDEAVSMAYKLDLHEEASTESKTVGTTLTRGTKFQVLDKETNEKGEVVYYKVRLNSDNIGWVRAEDIVVI